MQALGVFTFHNQIEHVRPSIANYVSSNSSKIASFSGNAGAPAVLKVDETYVLVGFVSHVGNCRVQIFVLQNVINHVDWIDRIVPKIKL